MPEGAANKTEPPTAERLRKAKEEGQVPTSQELPLALTIGALLLALSLSAETLWQWFSQQVVEGFTLAGHLRLNAETVTRLMETKGWAALAIIAPFMVALGVVSVASGLMVGGWAFAPKAIVPKAQQMDPVKGFKRLFSTRSLVRLVASWVKLGIMVAIVLTYLHGRLGECLALAWATPLASLGVTMRVILGLTSRFAAGMVVIALLDVLYQKWQHKKDLRMSKQEVKEERRQHEAAPEVRSRLRQAQIEMVRKRMLHEVPQADVVLVNPTHVAVALQYDAANMEAPMVTAKGADYLAERIREIARAHGVPILRRPELARTIYRTVDAGEPVPEPLYVAVAEILALIYRLRRERAGG